MKQGHYVTYRFIEESYDISMTTSNKILHENLRLKNKLFALNPA